MIREQKSDLQNYFIIKKDLDMPVKVRLYFLIFENVLDQSKNLRTIEQRKGFSKQLVNAFTNLSLSQKGQYLLSNINFVVEQLDHQERQKTKSDSKIQTDQIQHVETTCQMLLSALKISYWTTVSLKLDKIKKILSVTNKKKCFIIEMKNYFVRRSKKYKYSVVLQAITQEINNQAKKYVFCFNTHTINKLYEQMLKCCLHCQHQKILSLITEEDEDEKDEKHSQVSEKERALVFLNSKNINDYLAYKQKVEKQIMQNKFQFKQIYCQNNLKIDHSQKIDKIFRMQNTYEIDSKQLKQKFLYSFTNNNKFIIQSQLLQSFSKKYKAIYEKIAIKTKLYEYISIRQQSLSLQEEQILFVKGVENIMGRNYIEFIQVRVRTLSPVTSKIIVYVCIGLNSFINRDVVKMFLMEMNQMMFRKKKGGEGKAEGKSVDGKSSDGKGSGSVDCEEEEENEDDDDFKTVKGSEQFVGYLQDDSQFDQLQLKHKNESQSLSEQKSPTKSAYLHKKTFQSPLPYPQHAPKYHIFLKQHYLFKQWKRVKAGGVICTNEQTITKQKNLFKQGLSKFGKNILKGQILKLSLPVIIFKKQSHLETIAKNFSYAPMFFDQVAKNGSVLERVKYATLLAISVGVLGISMDKPFNPVLGQTLQARLDGCPIYLQQISHHPPIGAYLFYGRGYKIYGEIQPRISFGLNNVKGFSIRPNYIQFYDNQSIIQLIFGKMVIKGMLFGDRQFCYEDKVYAYDKTNHIFSQIIYGPKKKNKKNYPQDFIYGTIYRLKQQFLQKFNKSNPRIYPTKQFILQQLSTFQGIWNDQIQFDNKVYINFAKDLPFELIHEENPLLSNSSYRLDLQRLIQNNLEESQKQKDKMEESQRRDRKLRESKQH